MSDESPDLIGMVRTDMAAMEYRIMARLDRNVSKDLFEAEQRNHAERHRLMEERLHEESMRAMAAEKRLSIELAETRDAQAAADAARKAGVRRLWVGLATSITALGGILAAVEQLIRATGH